MAQTKSVRRKAAKSSLKKPAKKSRSTSQKKTNKAVGIKGPASRPVKKKTAVKARKSTSGKAAAKKTAPAKIKKSQGRKGQPRKTLSQTSRTPKKSSVASASSKPSSQIAPSALTATDRYNIGGLFACAIERNTDPDFKRIRSILRELELTLLEKDNLIRLSQGFTIPKLFADGISLDKAGPVVERLVKFALGEGGYEKKWRRDIHQVAAWLGVTSPQVEALEQRLGAKA